MSGTEIDTEQGRYLLTETPTCPEVSIMITNSFVKVAECFSGDCYTTCKKLCMFIQSAL